MMKLINYVILSLLLTAAFFLKDSIHISTNLLALFAPKEAIEKLRIANELGYSKEMFIAVEGFDRGAKETTKAIAKAIASLDGIKRVTYTTIPDKKVEHYFKEYYPLLADFNSSELGYEEVKKALEDIYKKQQESFFYMPVDARDPLKLFRFSQNGAAVSHRGKYLTLGDYGYLIKVTTDVAPSEMQKARVLYSELEQIFSKYDNVTAFAGFFYSVENSQKIKEDVKWIVILSTLMLLLIYFIMLRSLRLLTHTTVALASSMAFAALVCTTTIENFGVLSLAFGTSLTAVSIDYFFHYYFHDFYQSKRRFDWSVFFGYLTTISAFAIFAFIPVAMISQISIFALLSLTFAYLIFTFVFPYLEIPRYKTRAKERAFKYRVKAPWVTLFSLLLIVYSISHVEFNDNIRDLDYKNVKLQKAQKLFMEGNKEKLYPVIVEAATKDELLRRLHTIKEKTALSFSFANFVPTAQACREKEQQLKSYNFEDLQKSIAKAAKELGFKEGYFDNAYAFTRSLPPCKDINLDNFASLNLSLYQESGRLYTIAMVDSLESIKDLDYVSSIDVKEMFAKVANQMLEDILLYSSIVVVVIMALLFYSVRGAFFYAFNYILFPLSFTLAVIVSFYSLNIMHLFALIILIAIGIDYGIYMSNSTKKENTMLAIKYSLLSTFAAFGVLIFSSITALHSIGIVITLGCGAIYLLIKGMR